MTNTIKKELPLNNINDNTKSQSNYIKLERNSRAKAIKMKCLDCCAYQKSEVRLCTSYECPLWRYRTGKETKDELYFQSYPSKLHGS